MNNNFTNNSLVTQYHIFYSENLDNIVPIELEPGSSVCSGQPNHEVFSDKNEMEQRAKELGYNFD